ncbi:MAG: TlpA family protein disulfide reductase [Spirochaetaceae bacterium]|jgi:thiol-disulfide isomerase/thioredoxin|nr:TlpA family protein disulfide reductase [Spirochaetaceae bacterium]
MKRFVPAVLCLWAAVHIFPQSPANRGRAVPPAVAAAFAEAGIPVLRERVSVVDFSAPLPDGKTVSLSGLRGKVVFLNFWATWCGPCRAEMPSMEVLYRRFKDRGLEILAVNLRESPREVTAFMERLRLSFPAPLDQRGSIGANYGITAVPTTYIIDREGGVIARVVGSINWDTPQLFSAFETLLASP